MQEIVQARQAQLGNVAVHYEMETHYSPPHERVERHSQKNPKAVPLSGVVRESAEFSISGNVSHYKKTVTERELEFQPPANARDHALDEQTFQNGRLERLIKDQDGRILETTIENTPLLPEADIEIALGLRGQFERFRISPDLRNVTVSEEKEKAVMQYKTDKGIVHRWTFDPKRSYALVTYTRADPNGTVLFEMTADKFEMVNGVALPKSMVLTAFSTVDGKYQVVRKANISVKDYALNDPKNTADSLHIVWPRGSVVNDTRIHQKLPITDDHSRLRDSDVYDRTVKLIERGNPPDGVPNQTIPGK
jgi:hypothetical protein